MNIISKMPKWAQSTATKLRSREAIEGQKSEELTSKSIQHAMEVAIGSTAMVGLDEAEGLDEAMGEPGLVVQDSLQMNFDGDVSGAGGEYQLLWQNVQGDSESVAYTYNGTDENLHTIELGKKDGVVSYQSTYVQRTGDSSFEGYLVTGTVPA